MEKRGRIGLLIFALAAFYVISQISSGKNTPTTTYQSPEEIAADEIYAKTGGVLLGNGDVIFPGDPAKTAAVRSMRMGIVAAERKKQCPQGPGWICIK